MVKITDVALHAGVSPSTVSHVLNGKRPISQATRERVMTAIRELNYVPNLNARALKSAQTGIIGFFAADITEVFINEIIRGVESVIVSAGAHLLLVSGSEFENNLHQAIDFLNSRSVDGIIISYGVSQEYGDPDFCSPKIPVITINRILNDRTPSIMPDNKTGGRDAAHHLAEKGVRNIVIIGGPKNRLASTRRIEGFKEAAMNLGLNIKGIVHTEFSFDGGKDAMEKIFKKGYSFEGLFCANDFIAAGAITFAQKKGILIPGELKVIGFDDRDFASFWPIPITTFRQSLFDMGQTSARYLKEYLEIGTPIPLITEFPSPLQIRESSGG